MRSAIKLLRLSFSLHICSGMWSNDFVLSSLLLLSCIIGLAVPTSIRSSHRNHESYIDVIMREIGHKAILSIGPEKLNPALK